MNTTQALHLAQEARKTYYALNIAWGKAKNLAEARRLDAICNRAQIRWNRREAALDALITEESTRG